MRLNFCICLYHGKVFYEYYNFPLLSELIFLFHLKYIIYKYNLRIKERLSFLGVTFIILLNLDRFFSCGKIHKFDFFIRKLIK